MMSMFRKSWMRSRRTVCAALCLVFLSSLLAVSAGAVELTDRRFRAVVSSGISGSDLVAHFPDYSYSTESGSQSGSVYSNTSIDESDILVNFWRGHFYDVNTTLYGSVAVYLSWYLDANFVSSFSSPSPSSYVPSFLIYDHNDISQAVNSSGVKVSSYGVSPVDGHTVSRGYLLKGRINNIDSIAEAYQLRFVLNSATDPTTTFSITKPSGVPGSVDLVIPSIVLLTGEGNTLDSLENIADGIAAQSEILNSMYGDLMELLNDLYARLGDMQAVEELTNTYFAQLIPLVNSINTNTANIYSLLQTQFQLLRTLISTESDDIQAAIEKQTEDLITYFDTVFSGSTGSMPEKSDDLETSVGDFNDAESDYQSMATQRFDQLANAFSGFSGGTLGGVTLAATLFSRVWEALGEYQIVYTWPLLLGLCLVVIGRLSRLSGGQSSSVKNRGDSDA